MKKDNSVYYWIVGLSAAALLMSVMVYLLSIGDAFASAVCHAIDASNPCKKVQDSGFANLFGVHNSIIGLLGFSALMLLSLYQMRRKDKISLYMIIAGCILAGIFSVYFLYLQSVVIGYYCFFCVGVDAISLVLLVIGLWLWKKK